MFRNFQKNHSFKELVLNFIVLVFVLSSCSSNESAVELPESTEELELKCAGNKGGGLLLDYELVNAMTAEQIEAAVGPAFASLIKHNVEMYKVSYLTSFNDQVITVSGIVGVPDVEVDHKTPVVMYNHGTRVSEGDFVPSSGFDLLTIVAAANGKICFASDYVGYGDSDAFYPPYMINSADVFPVCDMVVAGKLFLMRKLKIFGRLSITMFGYSQGASVTQVVQRELETNPFYRWVVKLNGVATGTGPYDLYDNVVLPIISDNTYSGPAFLLYTFISYNNYYRLGYDLNSIFQSDYAQQFIEMQEANQTYAEINAILPTSMAELFQTEFRQSFLAGETPFNALFEQNATHENWVPKSPTRIYHSEDDEIVPYESAEEAYNTFVNAGAKNVELITYKGYNHTTTAFVSIFDILAWVDEETSNK